jgi:hypothetical protein
MFRKRRQMKKLLRVAKVLLEVDPGANRLPPDPRVRPRHRYVLGRG